MKAVHRFFGALFFAAILFQSQTAQAGMPTVNYLLTAYGADRLIGISTALFVIGCIAALPIMYCWNALVAGNEENRFLRKLSYFKALGLTFLGGILFSLVLVMIAGSRELFSPGVWVPDGALSKTVYSVEREKLKHSLNQTADNDLDLLRREGIVKLRDALKLYVKEHDGRLPASIEESQFGTLWTVPFASGVQYEYFPADEKETHLPLVREPALLLDAKFSLGRAFEIVEANP